MISIRRLITPLARISVGHGPFDSCCHSCWQVLNRGKDDISHFKSFTLVLPSIAAVYWALIELSSDSVNET